MRTLRLGVPQGCGERFPRGLTSRRAPAGTGDPEKDLAIVAKAYALATMMARILTNLALAALLTGAGVWLLRQDHWSLPMKHDPARALLFHGASLRLLAGALLSLAAFALAVAYGRLTGRIPDTDPRDPTAKGRLLARFWYLILTAFVCLALAFVLAERVAATR